MKPTQRLLSTGLICASMAFAGQASARETIQIAGSSTLLPFSSIAAEEFAQAFMQFRTPVVASGGTGGGLRQFCQGTGLHTIDIANASRAIKASEIDSCAAQGVKRIMEIPVGYDGIVFASRNDQASLGLSARQIYLAAAAQINVDGQWVDNPYSRWSQVDSSLPDREIVLVVPASNHGTREVFAEKLLLQGCQGLEAITALPDSEREGYCTGLRADGRVIEVAGDYTETLARLQMQPQALGVFGLNFYEQNRDRLQVAAIDDVLPSLDSIGDGSYPVSRPLYFYVKGEHLDLVPGLKEFVEYFMDESVSGSGSPLEEAGLIPLGTQEREQAQAAFASGKTLR